METMVRCHIGGAVAQLGERNAGSVEVRGSIPLSSTSCAKKKSPRLLFYWIYLTFLLSILPWRWFWRWFSKTKFGILLWYFFLVKNIKKLCSAHTLPFKFSGRLLAASKSLLTSPYKTKNLLGFRDKSSFLSGLSSWASFFYSLQKKDDRRSEKKKFFLLFADFNSMWPSGRVPQACPGVSEPDE